MEELLMINEITQLITNERFAFFIIVLIAGAYIIVSIVFETIKSLLKLISALLLILVISVSALIFKIEKISSNVLYKNNHSTYEVNNHKEKEK